MRRIWLWPFVAKKYATNTAPNRVTYLPIVIKIRRYGWISSPCIINKIMICIRARSWAKEKERKRLRIKAHWRKLNCIQIQNCQQMYTIVVKKIKLYTNIKSSTNAYRLWISDRKPCCKWREKYLIETAAQLRLYKWFKIYNHKRLIVYHKYKLAQLITLQVTWRFKVPPWDVKRKIATNIVSETIAIKLAALLRNYRNYRWRVSRAT